MSRSLKEVKSQHEATTKFILEGDGRGPFYHFVSPLGGLPQASKDGILNFGGSKRKSICETNVPDVLPIRLSPMKGLPLDVSSPLLTKKTSNVPGGVAEAKLPEDSTSQK
jgi:hypothetical protein